MADLRGRGGRAPTRGSKFFQFHAVFGKSWRPPPRVNPGSATASATSRSKFAHFRAIFRNNRLAHLPARLAPLVWEILDPALLAVMKNNYPNLLPKLFNKLCNLIEGFQRTRAHLTYHAALISLSRSEHHFVYYRSVCSELNIHQKVKNNWLKIDWMIFDLVT